LHDGDTVTVSCAEGAVGKVLEGDVKFHRYVTNLTDIPRPKTKIMVNLGNPEMAFKVSSMPCDGVGLARMEFIISEHIKAHPMALLHPERIKNIGERKKVLNLLKHYPDGANFFIEKLSGGIGIICAAFYPRPVIVRLSDFKTNEYASLMGGRDFELHEGDCFDYANARCAVGKQSFCTQRIR
jgi:pyruvate,water dikinase